MYKVTKQGLNCKNSESIKTRIETLVFFQILSLHLGGKNSESIKTRIETFVQIPPLLLSSFVRIVNPLKQGLRRF